jgi:hypothetical protein
MGRSDGDIFKAGSEASAKQCRGNRISGVNDLE